MWFVRGGGLLNGMAGRLTTCSTPSPNLTTMDRFEILLTPEGTTILRSLNPGVGGRLAGNNCPATAAALAHYLATGTVRPAQSVMAGQGFIQTDTGRFINASLHSITQSISGAHRHGQFRVVTGDSPGHHHEFVLVNIRGIVYYADAQTRPPIITRDLSGYLSWVQQFTWYSGTGYTVRLSR